MLRATAIPLVLLLLAPFAGASTPPGPGPACAPFGLHAHFVDATESNCHAQATVSVCTARYFGGGGGKPIDNFVWYCNPVLSTGWL